MLVVLAGFGVIDWSMFVALEDHVSWQWSPLPFAEVLVDLTSGFKWSGQVQVDFRQSGFEDLVRKLVGLKLGLQLVDVCDRSLSQELVPEVRVCCSLLLCWALLLLLEWPMYAAGWDGAHHLESFY